MHFDIYNRLAEVVENPTKVLEKTKSELDQFKQQFLLPEELSTPEKVRRVLALKSSLDQYAMDLQEEHAEHMRQSLPPIETYNKKGGFEALSTEQQWHIYRTMEKYHDGHVNDRQGTLQGDFFSLKDTDDIIMRNRMGISLSINMKGEAVPPEFYYAPSTSIELKNTNLSSFQDKFQYMEKLETIRFMGFDSAELKETLKTITRPPNCKNWSKYD